MLIFAEECAAPILHDEQITFMQMLTSLGTTVAQWLRCWATDWKVTGSIPDGFNEIFH